MPEIDFGVVTSFNGLSVTLIARKDGNSGWWLEGQSSSGAGWKVGAFFQSQMEKMGLGTLKLPDSIEELEVTRLDVAYHAGSGEMRLSAHVDFPVDGNMLDLAVKAGTHTGLSFVLQLAGQDFTVTFNDEQDKAFIATYHHEPDKPPLSLTDLARDALPALGDLPVELEVEQVLFTHYPAQDQGEAVTLLAVEVDGQADLGQLPLAGKAFPDGQAPSVDGFRLLLASRPCSKKDVTTINTLLPKGLTPLPEDLGQGVTLSALLNLIGGETHSFLLALGAGEPQESQGDAEAQPAAVLATADPGAQTPASPGNVKWIAVQKTFGPVYLARIGLGFSEGQARFLLDASLSLGGITFSMIGLGVSTTLKPFAPHFELSGLGLDFDRTPVEIGGAFLRSLVNGTDEYSGAAVIRMETFSLAALGSYAELNGQASLFVYAVLDYPLGGPSFFFVTGLAAGFGYNRRVLLPDVSQVANFPLVQAAVQGSGPPADPLAELQVLDQDIPIALGSIFLAAGVHFTSFKQIDSFALLVASFDRGFELDVLGLSTVLVPSPDEGETKEPLAEIQLALRATFAPEQGFLGVQAQLTSASYILSHNCHLSGGFAFYSWFFGEHAGDFVLTVGGYHPSFQAPAHYPQVPRLAFDWQVDESISVQGQAYYALTSSAFMVGGSLQASWHSGPFRAWFNLGVDFLIAWKPYHYDAQLHLDVGASYTYDLFGTHTLSVDVGADLHIWGPEFSGKAEVDLDIVSFTVSFGADSPALGTPIDWPTFKKSFLPADDQVCGISVQGGLERTLGQGDDVRWIINPKELVLAVNSLVPSSTVSLSGDEGSIKGGNPFGIAPMGVETLQSVTTVVITREKGNVGDDFMIEGVTKSMPTGLWGSVQAIPYFLIEILPSPNLNGPRFVDALAGIQIQPKPPDHPSETLPLDVQNLLFDLELIDGAYKWIVYASFLEIEPLEDEHIRRETIRAEWGSEQTKAKRNDLMQALNLTEHVTTDRDTVDQFRVPPSVLIKTAGGVG